MLGVVSCLQKRDRFGTAVCLEIESGASQTNIGGQTILCLKQATNGLSSLT
jgi:hypothetical protein